MTSPAPVSAAVIGCGRFVPGKEGFAQGHAHGRGYRTAFPQITLYGVDPDPGNLAAFGEAFGLPAENLFASTQALYAAVVPDMVSIVTWPPLHAPQVQEAVAAGVKRILCEKPVALDNSEIDSLLEVCEREGVRLAIAHQRRYEPGFERMAELVRAGVVGPNPVFTGRVTDDWDMLSWTSHWFDMANFFFGGPPESILAGIDARGERRYGHAVEHHAVVFARYPGGEQAVFLSGPPAFGGYSVSVEGPKGLLRFQGDGVELLSPEGVQRFEIPAAEESYARLIRDLAGREPFRCEAAQGVWGTRMVFAAQESALYQRSVALPSGVKYAPLEVREHQPGRGAAGSRGRAVVLADVHHWEPELNRSGRDGLVAALEALGFGVSLVALEEREVTAQDLEGAALLVIYHTRQAPTEATRAQVGGWIAAGKPTLVAHCGIGAWGDWPDYCRWIGRRWVWQAQEGLPASAHPHLPCEIVAQTPGWSAPWRRGWLPRDEVYIRLAESGPLEEIATLEAGGESHPCAWRSASAPNLAVFLPGHRADLWELPVMREGLDAVIGVLRCGINLPGPQPPGK